MSEIKKLEWRSEPPYSVARPLFGIFYATEAVWKDDVFVSVVLAGSKLAPKTYPSVEAAKQAAQDDFESRISSCLADPAPQQALIATLTAALEFYGDRSNHTVRQGGEPLTPMKKDLGEKARTALAKASPATQGEPK